MKSSLEQLLSIVAEGKREAERVMENAESNYHLGRKTRVWAPDPAKHDCDQITFQGAR